MGWGWERWCDGAQPHNKKLRKGHVNDDNKLCKKPSASSTSVFFGIILIIDIGIMITNVANKPSVKAGAFLNP